MDPLLRTTIRRLDGLAHRREILAAGCSRRTLDDAWRSGAVQRIRHGLYGSPDLPEQVVRAARVGGALAGASALASRGAWSPPDEQLVVSVPHNARDLRDPDDAGRRLAPGGGDVLVLRDGTDLSSGERAIVSPSRAAAQALTHLEPDLAVAVVDSALRLSAPDRPHRSAVETLLRGRRARHLVTLLDARAESGTESVVRMRLLQAGIEAEIQVWVSDRHRVDLLVDGWLVVECTSYGFHGSPQQYENDRRRITDLTGLGYVVTEVTYHQVFQEWPAVLAALQRLLSDARPARLPRRPR